MQGSEVRPSGNRVRVRRSLGQSVIGCRLLNCRGPASLESVVRVYECRPSVGCPVVSFPVALPGRRGTGRPLLSSLLGPSEPGPGEVRLPNYSYIEGRGD